MKKSELKEVIKPMIKECVKEALYEEGLLSAVGSEVVKGMHAAPLVEQTQKQRSAPPMPVERPRTQENIKEQRQKLREALGSSAYNGVDLFENTQPMSSYEVAEAKPGSVDLGDPTDSGVDISSIMGSASRMWQAMK